MVEFSINLVYIFKNLLSVGLNFGCLAVIASSLFEAIRSLHYSASLEIAKKSLQEERLRLETANALLDRARVINELGHYTDPDDSRHER